MSTDGTRWCIPAVLLALVVAGCSSNDRPTLGAPVSAGAPVATADVPVPVGTADLPVPVGTADVPLPPTINSSDAPTVHRVEVTVGVDADPARVEPVPLGATVALVVTNPTSDDEFHLHGYELGAGTAVPAGQAQTFTFAANEAGEFALESHESGEVLLTLSVQ